MRSKLFGLAIASCLLAQSVSAAPMIRVSSEVAQGASGRGLSVVLAPAQVMSINFSGEKISSVTAGDRSQFVFNVSGSAITLKRIKRLNFPGEYSNSSRTTLHVMTTSGSGQKIYPITILFGSHSSASVIEVGGTDYVTSTPDQAPPKEIPLLTSQVPTVLSVPQEPKPSFSRKKENIALAPPPTEIEEIKSLPTPKTDEIKPKIEVEQEPKPEQKDEVKKPIPLPRIKQPPKPSLAKLFLRKKNDVDAVNSEQEPKPELSPSQRALLEMKQYQAKPSELKK
jgi:hypothetical protein